MQKHAIRREMDLMYAVEIKNLSKRYKNKEEPALKNINLSISEGETFGLLGPNGAGKTTMVRLILNILKPTTGSIKVFGIDVTSKKYDEKRKKIGFMLESIGVSYILTGYENMEFFDRIYHESASIVERKERIKSLLTFAGLWEVRDKKVATYSHGMCRRLALARALICDPSLIFLDEPTLGLDPEARSLIREMLLAQRDEGKTIFLTSHDLEEVEKICSNIAIINHGEMITQGPYDEIKSNFSRKRIAVKVREMGPWIEELGKEMKITVEDNKIYIEGEDSEKVFELLSKMGIKVQEMKIEEESLEDLYLKLVKSEPKRRKVLVSIAMKGVKR